MLVRAIECASRSQCVDRIVVSTDDEEIAGLAAASGAEVPFLRPAELATDTAATVPVVLHALNALMLDGSPITTAGCLYPAPPLLRPEDLRLGYEAIANGDAAFSMAVSRFCTPIERALTVTAEGRIQMRWPEFRGTRTQEFEPAYHDAGQFYWGRAESWISESEIFGPDTCPIFLPRARAVDIDTLEDWDFALKLYEIESRSRW